MESAIYGGRASQFSEYNYASITNVNGRWPFAYFVSSFIININLLFDLKLIMKLNTPSFTTYLSIVVHNRNYKQTFNYDICKTLVPTLG
jgi:hypothetical protein